MPLGMVVPTTFQPTLPARGATRPACNLRRISGHISTHAPRTGSDLHYASEVVQMPTFQPTLPARGATTSLTILTTLTPAFQPTLPARGATLHGRLFRIPFAGFQPTLPARGATATAQARL